MNKKQFIELRSGTLVEFQGDLYRVLSASGRVISFFNKNKKQKDYLGIVCIHEDTNTFTFVKTIDGFRFEARVLTKNGFLVMFGRGESFYRWNNLIDSIYSKQGEYVFASKQITSDSEGIVSERIFHDSEDITSNKAYKKVMNFKEEIVWDKNYPSSPSLPLSRTHETVSIFSKNQAKINKIFVPYVESKKHDLDKVIGDINRIKSVLSKSSQLDAVNDFLETKVQKFHGYKRDGGVTYGASTRQNNPTVGVFRMIEDGMVEKSIIKCEHDRYSRIHPTQKPVRLLERLLALVIPDKPKNEIVVADFFGGSMSCMEAVHNMGMQGIACEIDEEYFELGKKRIEDLMKQTKLEL